MSDLYATHNACAPDMGNVGKTGYVYVTPDTTETIALSVFWMDAVGTEVEMSRGGVDVYLGGKVSPVTTE